MFGMQLNHFSAEKRGKVSLVQLVTSLFNCWVSVSHCRSAPQIVLVFILEAEQIHEFSHPWEANWFCCCSRRQRLARFVFCEWHFWLFFFWSQSAQAQVPHHHLGSTRCFFAIFTDLMGRDTGRSRVGFAESFLKMMLLMRETRGPASLC